MAKRERGEPRRERDEEREELDERVIDITRVAKVVKCEKHPSADKLSDRPLAAAVSNSRIASWCICFAE